MRSARKARLARAGWKIGSAAEFLSLTPEEREFVEMKVGLSQALRHWRTSKRLTQGELAEALGSSQARVARMEAADPSVSVDLLLRSLLKVGASRKDIVRALK